MDSNERETNLNKLTIPQLKQYAKDNDIRVPSKVTRKADIIKTIQDSIKTKEFGKVEVTIDRDALGIIALNSDPKTLINLCSTDKKFKELCDSTFFWTRKLLNDFDELPDKELTVDGYKEFYEYLYALSLSYSDLQEYCKDTKICNSIDFWNDKLNQDYPDRPKRTYKSIVDEPEEKIREMGPNFYVEMLIRKKDEYKYLNVQSTNTEKKGQLLYLDDDKYLITRVIKKGLIQVTAIPHYYGPYVVDNLEPVTPFMIYLKDGDCYRPAEKDGLGKYVFVEGYLPICYR